MKHILLIGIIVFSLTSCGNNGNTNSSASDSTGKSKSPKSDSTAADPIISNSGDTVSGSRGSAGAAPGATNDANAKASAGRTGDSTGTRSPNSSSANGSSATGSSPQPK